MFPFLNCLQVPQINWKFKSLPVSPHNKTFLVKINLGILEKSLYHTNKCMRMSLNIGIELPNFKGSRMFFRDQFPTQTWFETT